MSVYLDDFRVRRTPGSCPCGWSRLTGTALAATEDPLIVEEVCRCGRSATIRFESAFERDRFVEAPRDGSTPTTEETP